MNNKSKAWPLRPFLMSGFLAVVGLILYFLLNDKHAVPLNEQVRTTIAAFVATAAMIIAFSLERVRISRVLLFSLFWAVVVAFVTYSTLFFDPDHEIFNLSMVAVMIAVGIALPIFQSLYQQDSFSLVYSDLHENAWNNTLCWFACWVFVGLSFAVANLLAALFDLIGISVLELLLRKEWFTSLLIGASFGATLGVLKENVRIVSSLQGLVMAVLSILTPVLCVGLVSFLVALIFTGLEPFWNSTESTTPIVLSVAIAAITLANTIIRNSADEESQNKIQRYSAIGLSLCLLPMATISLISVQQRVDQYGLTPQRIWGIVSVLVTLAYGLAYMTSLLWTALKSQATWTENLRKTNIIMAIFLCITMLILALPILDFSKMSVNSQLARLHNGDVLIEDFDYAAFAFDFGDRGKDVLKEMQSSSNEVQANRATLALAANSKWELGSQIETELSAQRMSSVLTVFPETDAPVPEELKTMINEIAACIGRYCVLFWEPNTKQARLVTEAKYCNDSLRYVSDIHDRDDKPYEYCPPEVNVISFVDNSWTYGDHYSYRTPTDSSSKDDGSTKDKEAILNAVQQKEIEIRTVERKQIFIGGKPVGDAY